MAKQKRIVICKRLTDENSIKIPGLKTNHLCISINNFSAEVLIVDITSSLCCLLLMVMQGSKYKPL